jgi:hypothetical protein
LETGPIISKAGLFQKKKPFRVPRSRFEPMDRDCSGIPGDERIELLEKLPELQPCHTVPDLSIPTLGKTKATAFESYLRSLLVFSALDTDIDRIKLNSEVQGKRQRNKAKPRKKSARRTRNKTLFSVLCVLFFRGYTPHEARPQIHSINQIYSKGQAD